MITPLVRTGDVENLETSTAHTAVRDELTYASNKKRPILDSTVKFFSCPQDPLTTHVVQVRVTRGTQLDSPMLTV